VNQYRLRSVEVISAHQWMQNGDHPDDHSDGETEGHLVRYFRHPGKRGDDKCRRCGKRWNDHGWIEPRSVKGQAYWQEGATVCPGDYIVTEQVWTNGVPQYSVIGRKSFEGTYEPVPSEEPVTRIAESLTGNPKVFAESVWDRFGEDQKAALIEKGNGAGVLIIPDELFYRED
jgi:hypothetical protein